MPTCNFPQRLHPDRSCQRPATHILVFWDYDRAVCGPQWHVQAQTPASPYPQEPHYCLRHARSIVQHLNAGLRRRYDRPTLQEGPR
jgi:hypothetical protein